jgi:putative transposase
MKRVAEALGVSRSNLSEKERGKTPSRGPYMKAEDDALLPLIRRFVDERPTYGYRRIAALVNRKRAQQGLPPANRKRVHRVMHRPKAVLRYRAEIADLKPLHSGCHH